MLAYKTRRQPLPARRFGEEGRDIEPGYGCRDVSDKAKVFSSFLERTNIKTDQELRGIAEKNDMRLKVRDPFVADAKFDRTQSHIPAPAKPQSGRRS